MSFGGATMQPTISTYNFFFLKHCNFCHPELFSQVWLDLVLFWQRETHSLEMKLLAAVPLNGKISERRPVEMTNKKQFRLVEHVSISQGFPETLISENSISNCTSCYYPGWCTHIIVIWAFKGSIANP